MRQEFANEFVTVKSYVTMVTRAVRLNESCHYHCPLFNEQLWSNVTCESVCVFLVYNSMVFLHDSLCSHQSNQRHGP